MRAPAGQGRPRRDLRGRRHRVPRGPRDARRRQSCCAIPTATSARSCGCASRPRHRPVRRRGHRDQRGHLALPRGGVGRPARALAARRRDQDPARPGRRADADEGARLFERAARSIGSRRARPARRRPARAQRARPAAARPQHAALGPAGGGPGAADRGRPGRYPLREHVTGPAGTRCSSSGCGRCSASWYELFPRSEGAQFDPMGRREPQSGTFRTAARGSRRSPRWASTSSTCRRSTRSAPRSARARTTRCTPGRTTRARRGRSARPRAATTRSTPSSARSPTSTPSSRAGKLGMEVALDLALQASPDHPWVKEHPEWFTTRADGSIAYAENPPKKYQDIYPLNFDNDPEGIYGEVERGSSGCGWSHGVRIFRVDNPHTKPVGFWERLLGEHRRDRPRRAVPGRGVHQPGDDAHASPRSASTSPTRTSPGATARTSWRST